MSERKFNEAEITVLDRFFTGVKELSNVYAAKPTLPSAVWAFLTGAYSRSSFTMREKLLLTFQEIYGADYNEMILKLSAGSDDQMQDVVARAERFLSTWAVQYGHNSLKDSSTDRFAVEGISIRAAKFIEWVALGAYQEKSTRYADFSSVSFITYFMPESIRGLADQAFNSCLDAYKTIFESAYTQFELEMRDVEPHEQIRTRTCRAKAFDVARYILPVTTPTSLGITIPSRATEDLIRWLRSSPYKEAQQIGELLYTCGSEVNQSLIKHVEVNTASLADHPAIIPNARVEDETLKRIRQAIHEIAEEHRDSTMYRVGNVALSTAPDNSHMNPRYLAAAALAKERLSLLEPLADIATGLVYNQSLIESIFDSLLVKRGPHQAVPKAIGVGELMFSGIIDYGAYRDLQRHRRGFQLRIFPTNKRGYSVPDFVNDHPELLELYNKTISDLEALGEAYVTAADANGEAYDPTIIEYFTVLAHNVEFTYCCSVEQAIYLIELRTSPAGHVSYRRFAQAMAKLLFQVIPELTTHVNVCWDSTGDRRSSEAATQRKLEAIAPRKADQ